MPSFRVPRGTSDILVDAMSQWQALEGAARLLFRHYCYQEVRTPMFEETDLFARSMGQTSDVVHKQMLNLAAQPRPEDSGPRLSGLSLRPEGTAAAVRAYIEHHCDQAEPLTKWFYIGPMFRGERPQKGRLRQFTQIGAEAIGPGTASPYLDAEMMILCGDILRAVGIDDFCLHVNTLGSRDDKEALAGRLRDMLGSRRPDLCPECRDRFDRNVFRILDCKNPDCRTLVETLQIGHDHLSAASRDYFSKVIAALDRHGIKYKNSPHLVRGLDYYTHTVFEITAEGLGSQDALGAGGRYNDLVKQLGGPAADATGFALGMERILIALEGRTAAPDVLPVVEAFAVVLDEAAAGTAFAAVQALRRAGVAADMSFKTASAKSQMRAANKAGSRWTIVIGEDELRQGAVTLKDMADGGQETVSVAGENFTELIEKIRQS